MPAVRTGDSNSLPVAVAMLAPAARLGIRIAGHAPGRAGPIAALLVDVLSLPVHAGSCRNARGALDELHRADSLPAAAAAAAPARRPSAHPDRSAR
jgi:hypothetical protein